MFNAFISYSHSADDKFAPALQNALQKFAKPWYKKRNLEIFRDESSLSVSPHLWENITKALDQSQYLILLGSSASENSHWVNEEVKYWLEHKSIETILIALTEGEMKWDTKNNCYLEPDNNSLPPALDNEFTSEPFYIDLRQSKTEKDISLDNPIFNKEVLKLAAKLHNKTPNDLASEEVTVHRKMVLLRNSIFTILTLLLVFSIFQTIKANDQTEIANEQTEIANEQTEIVTAQKIRAQANYLMSEAQRISDINPSLGLRLAEAALNIFPNDSSIYQKTIKLYGDHYFGQILIDSIKGPITFTSDKKKILIGGDKAGIYDLNGNLIKGLGVNINSLSLNDKYIFTNYRPHNLDLDDSKNMEVYEKSNWAKHEDWMLVQEGKFSPIDINKILYFRNYHGAFLADLDGNNIAKFPGERPFDFSPNGKAIFTTEKPEFGYNYGILSSLNGEELTKIIGHNGAITSVKFSPNGKSILTGSNDTSVRLWDLTGKELQLFPNHHEFGVEALAFSSNGNRILTGSNEIIRQWDIDGREISKFGQSNHKITSVGFVQDPYSFISSSNSDGTVRLWYWPGMELINVKAHSNIITCMKISSDGNYILSGSADKSAKLWDMSGKLVRKIENLPGQLTSVDISVKNNRIVTGSVIRGEGFFIKLFDLNANKIKEIKLPVGSLKGGQVRMSFDEDNMLIAKGGDEEIMNGMIMFPNSSSLNSDPNSYKSELIILDLDGNENARLKGPQTEVTSISFSNDGSSMLTVDSLGGLQLRDYEGNMIKRLNIEGAYIISAIFFQDDEKILVATSKNNAILASLDGEIIQKFNGHSMQIKSIACSDDGKSILTGSVDRTAILWDINGKIQKRYIGHTDEVSTVSFSKDGKAVITGSYDGSLRIWDLPPHLKDFLQSDRIPKLTIEQKEHYEIEN